MREGAVKTKPSQGSIGRTRTCIGLSRFQARHAGLGPGNGLFRWGPSLLCSILSLNLPEFWEAQTRTFRDVRRG